MTTQVSTRTSIRRMFSSEWREEWTEDARQFVAVLIMAAIALAFGYGIEQIATNSTRTVSAGSVSAQVPTTWVFQPGAQDLLFTVIDPRNPGQRYSVTRPSTGKLDATSVENATVAAKAQLLPEFQVLSRGVVSINGADVPTVTYVYVSNRNGSVPQVIEGEDAFVQGQSATLVVTLESPTKSFDDAFDTFQKFAASVKG